MTAFEVVDYDASRRDAYLRLLAEAFDGGGPTAAEFDWWLHRDPGAFIGCVAAIEDDVVGASMHSVFRAVLGGQERAVQFSLNNVTAANVRGLGIWQTLERRNEELGRERGTALALSFANEVSIPIFLGPLDWQRIDRRRVWVRPLRGLLRRPSRSGRKAPARRSDLHDGVMPVAQFGPEHDAVYLGVQERLGDHVVRDHGYLNWRYVDSPRGYVALASGDGFAVLGRTVRRGLTFALLMDLIAPPEHGGTLLRACVAAASDADAMLALPTPCVPKTTLARHGFAPTHERLELLGYGLAESLDARQERWTYTLGDTDFF